MDWNRGEMEMSENKEVIYHPVERVDRAYLIHVSDDYIDYKKNPDEKQCYFAHLDRSNYGTQEFKDFIYKLRKALINGTNVDLILERKPGLFNKKQLMDYVIMAYFW